MNKRLKIARIAAAVIAAIAAVRYFAPVRSIEFRMAGFNVIRYPAISITPKAEGTVKFHIETKGGKVKSNTTAITVRK